MDQLSNSETSPSAGAASSLADIEAAVALVRAGLATRVLLVGFPSWPGLLWWLYQMAAESDVLILPIAVRPGGRVDLEIRPEAAGA